MTKKMNYEIATILLSQIYQTNEKLYKNLDLASIINLDIMAKQFESELKMLIWYALEGNNESFNQTKAVLKMDMPQKTLDIIKCAEDILKDNQKTKDQ